MSIKLRIKDSLCILKDSEDHYVFISSATRRVKKFKVDSLVKDIVRALESEPLERGLIEKLSSIYNEKDIRLCLEGLEREGLVRRYEENLGKERYSKQLLFLDELTDSQKETLELQRRIEKSKIAVFGVGGIGTWIVNGLYQMGVGEIRVTDSDIVEENNLNRLLFFDSGDIGRYKVDILKAKLKDANIVPFKKRVESQQNLADIVFGCNFLVNCADSPSIAETTSIIDGYSSKNDIAYCVAGGYNLHLGMIGPIIIPGVTKTFDDFIRYQRETDSLKDLEEIRGVRKTGNLGPIAGAIANIQLMEIFKYLTGKGKININRFAEIDFMDFNVEWKEF